MIADTDVQEPSNGAPAVVANGTHKVVSQSLNGAAQNGKEPEHPQPTSYMGHNREELTRILIQALANMGFREAAALVSRDSGYELESPTVTAFRKAVLEGSWATAEELLESAVPASEQQQADGGLLLAPGADPNTMRLWLRQQKYLELLEQQQTQPALRVLRNELTPICYEHRQLHFLSGLLMCRSSEDLKTRADWDGAHGRSRQILLSELSSMSGIWSQSWFDAWCQLIWL